MQILHLNLWGKIHHYFEIKIHDTYQHLALLNIFVSHIYECLHKCPNGLQNNLQNVIDGLGITGYEGIFLRVCEITLSVLRSHRETLMSVLETFIHDPLVEWTKSHKSSGVEVQNPHAQVWYSVFVFILLM